MIIESIQRLIMSSVIHLQSWLLSAYHSRDFKYTEWMQSNKLPVS